MGTRARAHTNQQASQQLYDDYDVKANDHMELRE